jgi:hypothetical protein
MSNWEDNFINRQTAYLESIERARFEKQQTKQKEKEEKNRKKHEELYGDAKYRVGQIVGDWEIMIVKQKLMGIRYYRCRCTKYRERVSDLPEDLIEYPVHRYTAGVNDDPTPGFLIYGCYWEVKKGKHVPYYRVKKIIFDENWKAIGVEDTMYRVSQDRLTELIYGVYIKMAGLG